MLQNLYDKLWQNHVVHEESDGTALIYIDRHLVHEVTSPQAFEGLKLAGRKPWRTSSIVATADHNTPTNFWERGIEDPVSRLQVETLDANIREVGALAYFPFKDLRQGVVHVVGPENGATLPGMTVVCGDSHTSTHGAFGCMALGIGTSEVEHVLATQCLLQKKSKTMLLRVEGNLGKGVTAKDIALAIIGRIGTAGGTGYAIEFGGSAIRGLSMEARMTLCNMAIEAGARMGFIAVDNVTINYLKGRPFAPRGEVWEAAVTYWRTLHSDEGAHFDCVLDMRAEDIQPQVTWGTSPEMVAAIGDKVPDPAKMTDPVKREGAERALTTWGSIQIHRSRTSKLIRFLSALAPIPGSRICGRRRRLFAGAMWPLILSWRWWFRVPGWSKNRPRKKAWIRFLSRRVSSGVKRVVRCAWR